MENKMTTPKASDTRTARDSAFADIRNMIGEFAGGYGPKDLECALATLAAADAVPVAEVLGYRKQGFALLPVMGWKDGPPPIGTKLYAHPQQAAVPAGWVLVPKEPTEEMMGKAFAETPSFKPATRTDIGRVYRAMLASVEQQGEAK